MDRRNFLKTTAGIGLKSAMTASLIQLKTSKSKASNPLIETAGGVSVKLPPGFQMKAFSEKGERMSDGARVPKRHDGMTCFKGHLPGIEYVLVRNHEMDPGILSRSPFPDMAYDPKGVGGTSTILLDRNLSVVDQYMSLTGTVRNCSGGKTPWGTWVSCEESVARPRGFDIHGPLDGAFVDEPHGYAFEVDPYATSLQRAEPLKQMGRFRREAVAIEESTLICYQTEDQDDGCLYRFIPSVPGDLSSDGVLQAWAFDDPRLNETTGGPWVAGMEADGHWVTLEEPDPRGDSLRDEAQDKGAAWFQNGEGMMAVGDTILFTASAGGKYERGQVFEYNSTGKSTGKIKLVFEADNSGAMLKPDQLTTNSYGDIIVCEDSSERDSRLLAITPSGNLYQIAENDDSEWTGVCWSPDEKLLFANIQGTAVTVAIWGDWAALRRGR